MRILALLFFGFSATFLFAQRAEKQSLSMSDAILKEWRDYNPKNISRPQWVPGTNILSHTSGDKIVWLNAETMRTDTLHALDGWRTKLMEMGMDSLKRLPAYTWLSATEIAFNTATDYFSVNAAGTINHLNTIPKNAKNKDIHRPTHHIAYTQDDALKVSIDGTEMLVGRSEKAGIVYGQAVHRQEFGIFKGTFWSPKGDKLAFYRMDESMVTEYPIYDLDDMPASPRMIRYPYAGAKSHHVTVGVFNTQTKQTVYLNTGAPAEQYLTNVAWTPDGKSILIAVLNRAQNQMKLNQYDAVSGAFIKTLFEEKHDKWVEPEHPAKFVPNTNQFVWQSERDGFMHLYLYDLSGKMIQRLSAGKFPVTNFVGFDASGSLGFWEAADESGLSRHYYVTEIATGRQKQLSKKEGTHKMMFNDAGTYAFDNFQSTTVPRSVSIFSTAEPTLRKSYFEADNPLADVELGYMQMVDFPSQSGYRLNGRIILPPNFEDGKQYPAIQYVYNGPHAQLVRNTWKGAANLWMHRLAQEGFVVFTVDGRGSANRGFDFENALHRRCGDVEIEDQLTALEYLKGKSFINPDKVGIYGWSYGGFMATSLMTRPEAKGAFAAGAAGGAVIDWRMYEIMYTERYMDTPEENPEGYEKAALMNYIENLDKPLLLIHGTSDDIVLWQHTLRYVREAVKQGKHLEYFPYPHHGHNVRGKDRVHLFELIEDYFKRHLMEE